ncbi:MAG TPA: CCC motif membrane protein [Bacteroidia bacterium]|nr:CCC motif membrane protein [Bacteroidia bacterium]
MENSNTPNEQQINQQFNQQFGGAPSGQVPLPNSTAVLVLGIISIALCWCYGIVALTCGIIAIVLGNKAMALYKANPSAYTLSSFNNTKGGRICAIIGICLGSLYLIFIIIYLVILGTAFSMLPWQNMH